MDNVCEKKETPERLRGSPAASVSRPFVLRKKLFQGEGKRVIAGLHNLQLVLLSKYSQNFILKTRMLCFLRHSRQKCRKSMFLEQNSCFQPSGEKIFCPRPSVSEAFETKKILKN